MQDSRVLQSWPRFSFRRCLASCFPSNMSRIGGGSIHPTTPRPVAASRALSCFFGRPEDALTFWRAVQSGNWHVRNMPQSDSPGSISGIKDLIKGLLSFIHEAHHARETLSKEETRKPELTELSGQDARAAPAPICRLAGAAFDSSKQHEKGQPKG